MSPVNMPFLAAFPLGIHSSEDDMYPSNPCLKHINNKLLFTDSEY